MSVVPRSLQADIRCLVESGGMLCFFAEITSKRIRRGAFRSVATSNRRLPITSKSTTPTRSPFKGPLPRTGYSIESKEFANESLTQHTSGPEERSRLPWTKAEPALSCILLALLIFRDGGVADGSWSASYRTAAESLGGDGEVPCLDQACVLRRAQSFAA